MSVHAMIAAAYLEDLPASTKLVLMAIADSSDEHTREAAPGLPKLRAWSNLSKRHTLRVVRDLEAAGYLAQVLDGQRGRRAVWRVFPDGLPGIPRPSEVEARYEVVHIGETDTEPVDNPAGKGDAGDTQTAGMGDATRTIGCHPRHPFITDSVSRGDDSTNPPARRVDKPTPSASTGSGFPGARTPPEAGASKRARGGHDQPCPVADHGQRGEVAGGCGRCAHAAAKADPAQVAASRRAARAAIRKNHPTATTEETTPA